MLGTVAFVFGFILAFRAGAYKSLFRVFLSIVCFSFGAATVFSAGFIAFGDLVIFKCQNEEPKTNEGGAKAPPFPKKYSI